MKSAPLFVGGERERGNHVRKKFTWLKRFTWFMVFGILSVVGGLYTGRARATPATGFVGTTIALGRFSDIDVFNQQVIATNPWRGTDQAPEIWGSLQKTKGDSDTYVQSNVWQPGGDTGWHSHPGHSLIIVTAGAITDYESDDPDCKPAVYTKGMGFVDAGGEHVHLIRNAGTVVATTITIQVIPANAARRVDAAAPANCHL
jgi:hypothetical protein